ncbi:MULTISPECIES: hypothetical protein [Bacillus]|nr:MULTISPECIES: hypothetical protein [Bacillus]OUB47754.1 hypothetical protein BK740_07580 [Bacillus thuringiensis serovar argentinensis]KAA0771790.1 hypothetical protein DN392_18345 [Bacillus sp. BB51/4]KXY07742.1 hypothetical protein AT260_17115 [Bacillus wiedmannii]MBJ8081775.1 hypothetical protein [Bacillus cereus group sp. N14]OAK18692.1 hypothetical protein A6281_08300 [Bacillus wiedmannii]
MKHIYLYNKDTGAYIGDDVIFPRQEEIRGMVTKTRIETVVIGTEEADGYKYPIYGNEEVQYEEEDVIGYKDVYDIPDNATEIPLPQPNWKPVFKDGKWIETITQEELDELNKPQIPQPSELDKLKKQQELMQQALDELIISSI